MNLLKIAIKGVPSFLQRAQFEMRTRIRSLTRFIVYGNFWIALAAMVWVLQTISIFGLPRQWPLLILVFFATFWNYNLDRLLGIGQISHSQNDRFLWLIKHQKFLIISCVISLIPILWACLHLSLQQVVFFAHLSLISVCYALPIPLRKGRTIMLRKLPFLKVFLIAYVWAAMSALSPFLFSEGNELFNLISKSEIRLLFFERFVFILAITIPFDIRDFEQDASQGLKTFPSAIGKRNSILLSIALLIAYSFLCSCLYSTPILLTVLCGTALLAAVLISQSKSTRHDLFYTGIIDGLIILQAALILLLQ